MGTYGETYTSDNAYVPVAVGSEAYPWLSSNTIVPEVHQWTFEARRRCLNDSVWLDGQPAGSLVNTALSYSIGSGHVDFCCDPGEISITKRVIPSSHAAAIEYLFSSSSSLGSRDYRPWKWWGLNRAESFLIFRRRTAR